MAYRNGVLYETMFPEPVATELRLLSSTLLQISGLQALGRSLASLVVALRQLWLSGKMKAAVALLLLATLCAAVKRKRQQSEWDYRVDAEKVSLKGCANLTTVLDNWKFAIMTQVKDLLLHDHHTVLPDYGRIQPLSDALGDLFKEFNTLKERLGELTTKFNGIEGFVDDMRAGRGSSPPRQKRPPQPKGPTIRKRVVVQRLKKPVKKPEA
ncbi:UNVERIFIED_CONTAM: hypothetical protein FKN15_035520 [Acipenser sinensis]